MTDTNTNMSKERAMWRLREEFEAHWVKEGNSRTTLATWSGVDNVPKSAQHTYIMAGTRDAWAAFQAGRASLAASAGSEPVKRVFLVHTGEEHEGEATYTRHDDAPPPLCDSECLYTHPSPPEGMAGWKPIAESPEGEEVLLWSEVKGGPPILDDWARYKRINQPKFTHFMLARPPLPASEAKEL